MYRSINKESLQNKLNHRESQNFKLNTYHKVEAEKKVRDAFKYDNQSPDSYSGF
jgi:hypothetical protein